MMMTMGRWSLTPVGARRPPPSIGPSGPAAAGDDRGDPRYRPRVMTEEGVNGLSLAEVARRLGVQPPSLYKYFPSLMAVYDAPFFAANSSTSPSCARRWPRPNPDSML